MEKIKITDYVVDVPLTNEVGTFKVGAFVIEDKRGTRELYTLMYGNIQDVENLRINSACFTSDLFGCQRCDCNEQLQNAMKYFVQMGNGLLIYDVMQEGRGIGAIGKLKTLKIMDEKKCSTAEAFLELGYEKDCRDYSAAVEILKFLNVSRVNLITNNPDKINFLEKEGVEVVKRISSISENAKLQEYLLSKEKDMGHVITKEI